MVILNTAGLLLFIFYAVSFTKTPFVKLVKDQEWQSWLIRLWALTLGVVAAILESHSPQGWLGTSVYDAIKQGGAAAVGAIITYHIGNGDFVGVFDGAKTTTTEETAPARPALTIQADDPKFDVKPITEPEPVPDKPEEPSLTPAQKAGLVDLKTVTNTGTGS